MGRYINGHKICESDVRKAFDAFIDATEDGTAAISRKGSEYSLTSSVWAMKAKGAANTLDAISAFVAGWKAGRA